MPRFADGWQSILDALRGGRFFVTTGEVLISNFTLNGKRSGEVLQLVADGMVVLEADLEWTIPLAFVEFISGDGKSVSRERISLEKTGPSTNRRMEAPSDLAAGISRSS